MTEIDCTRARELMLEVDSVLLRARGGTPLERHIRDCSACAAAAAAILDSTDELRAALDSLANRASRGSGRVVTFRRLRPLPWAAALAAAAALVLILLRVVPDRPTPEPIVLNIDVPATTIVNVTDGRDVAVLQPTNPDITIIWLLQPAGTP